jgi:hypothetical protein
MYRDSDSFGQERKITIAATNSLVGVNRVCSQAPLRRQPSRHDKQNRTGQRGDCNQFKFAHDIAESRRYTDVSSSRKCLKPLTLGVSHVNASVVAID